MSKNVLVIGSINVDYVIHTHRLPTLGETVTGDGFSVNFGGKGANQAIALAKSGCHVKMLGAVGKDHSGDMALNNLRELGVDPDAVMRTDCPTGAAVITVCGGDNHIILDCGANACVTPEAVLQNEMLFDWADVVVMQYEIPVESVLAAARLARNKDKTVILNPAPVKAVDTALYEFVDWIIPNEFEVELITNIPQQNDDDAALAIQELRKLGCKNAIVTLGKRGCAYSLGKEVRYGGIFEVERVDTTAAGDSFIGGLCASLCDGANVNDAVYYASAVSSITVSRRGAGASIPTESEVKKFLKTHNMEKRTL